MMPLAPPSTPLPCAHRPKINFSIDSIVAGGSDGKGRCHNTTTRSASAVSRKRSQRSMSTGNIVFSEQNIAPPSSEPGFTASGNSSATCSREAGEIFSPFAYLLKSNHQLRNNNGNANLQQPIPVSHPLHRHLRPLHLLLSQGSHNSSADATVGNTFPSNLGAATCNHNSIPNIITSSCKKFSLGYQRDCAEGRYVDLMAPLSSSSSSPSQTPAFTRSITNNARRNSTPVNKDCFTSQHNSPKGIPQLFPCTLESPSPPQLSPAGSHGLPQLTSYTSSMLNFATAHHPPYHPGLPGWMPSHSSHHSAATAHPLYPWLLTKQSRLFPHRFGPGSDFPGLLLHSFRKPKRIRTAFSPTQLLKLEHTFERNHYVVGAERKKLAVSLSLSETQIKVWFQNRRTKHKRMQQEEPAEKQDDDGGSGGFGGDASGNGSSGLNFTSTAIAADSSTRSYNSEEMVMMMTMMSEDEEDDDDELIMDDAYSDQEEEEEEEKVVISKHLQQQ